MIVTDTVLIGLDILLSVGTIAFYHKRFLNPFPLAKCTCIIDPFKSLMCCKSTWTFHFAIFTPTYSQR